MKLTAEKLKGLSKAEKLALLDALDEKKRRDSEKRDTYAPNPGQLPVHQCDKKIRAVFSGNGGGKTALGVNEALWAATGYNPILKANTPVPARVIVVLDQPRKVEDLWLPEIKKWYPLKPEQLVKRGKPYIEQIRFENGSEILFMFHDQDPMAFESIELDWAIFDEPPPRSVYVGLRRGGRKKGRQSRYLIIGTPLAAPWLRTDLYEPWVRGEMPELECFRYSSFVNEQNLGTGELESLSRSLTEKERQIRLHGQFFDLEGLALAHLFRRDTHVIEPPRWPQGWPVIVAIDPHPSKRHTAVMLGVTPDNQFRALKEMASKSAARQFAKELKDFYKGYRVLDIVSDSLGSGDSTGGEGRLSFIAVLQSEGIRVRATTFQEKQDDAWISMIQDVLLLPDEPNNFGERKPRLQIASSCLGLINDIETVAWAKYRNLDEYKAKLDISTKDFLSSLKYCLATQPRFTKGRERVIRPNHPATWNTKERWRGGGTR
jgi:hypothetical protein